MVQRDNGNAFPIGYDILELVPPELLVLRSDPMPQMGMPEPSIVRVELHDHGDKTRMTLTDGPYPSGMSTAAEAGWGSALRPARGAVRRLAHGDRPRGERHVRECG